MEDRLLACMSTRRIQATETDTTTDALNVTRAAVTTMKPRQEGHFDRMPVEIAIPSAIGVSILCGTAIVGNVLIIISYITDKSLRTVNDYYILNLAISDLCIACVSIPVYVVYSLKRNWPFGRTICKLWLAADFTFCMETVLMILIISLDRLLYIKLGVDYSTKITGFAGNAQIVVSWIFAFLVYGPAIIWWDEWVGYSSIPETDCHVEFAYDIYYTTITAMIEFALPAIGLTVINGMIYKNIRWLIARRRKIAPVTTKSDTLYETVGVSHMSHWSRLSRRVRKPKIWYRKSCDSLSMRKTLHWKIPRITQDRRSLPDILQTVSHKIGDSWCASDPNHAKATRVQGRSFLKAARCLAALVIVFVLCWVPYTILTLILSVQENSVNPVLYEFFYWWLWVKSGVNPFLYAYNNSNYRRNFIKILTCKFLKG